MSRAVRYKKHLTTLQVFLSIVLVLLTVCVLVKAFFLKAPEQKAAELPAQSAASDTDSQQSPEEQAAQEALRSHLERKGGFYTILLSGLDDDNGGSDTNILVAVDTVNGYVYGVSIPRDSKAIIDGKARKINYAYNKGRHGASGRHRVGAAGYPGGLHGQRQSEGLYRAGGCHRRRGFRCPHQYGL